MYTCAMKHQYPTYKQIKIKLHTAVLILSRKIKYQPGDEQDGSILDRGLYRNT